jgi:DNA-nicking Smr family endonuclease
MGKENKDGGLSEEDLALWRRVTQDAAPLSGSKKPAPDKPPAAPRRPPPRRPPATAQDTRPREPDLTHGSSAGLDKRKAERLKRGRLPIEARLDLHGRTLDAAKGAVERFLADAQGAGKRCVLIVTGKGRGTTEGGLLRREVPNWLNEARNRARVVSFDYAQPKDGGQGALYVLLKRVRER